MAVLKINSTLFELPVLYPQLQWSDCYPLQVVNSKRNLQQKHL